MPDLSAYESDLLRQALHLEGVNETLWRIGSHTMPASERDRQLINVVERVAEFRELVERMLQDLDGRAEGFTPASRGNNLRATGTSRSRK